MRTSMSTKHGIPASERTVRHGPDNLELTHVNTAGEAHMVDVGYKSATRRVAIAQGSVRFSNPQPLDLVSANSNKKGDVLGVARIAALMAAKRTSDLIPLCHPVSISKAEVDITMVSSTGGGFNTVGGHGCAAIEARVDCVGVTGIEMEALTAVAVAALTIYDMCKAVDKRMVIEQARLVYKSGGKSGVFVDEEWYANKGGQYLDGGAEAQQ
jgi:cyclic pyranopterin phosphate synthase